MNIKEGDVFWVNDKIKYEEFGIELAYFKKVAEKVILITIQTEKRWPEIIGTGSGEHPCICFECGEVLFDFLSSEWNVWCVSSEKHGLNVTLVKD